jgi:hypothetical protein
MSLLKMDTLGIADKWGFAAWIGCIITYIAAAVFFEDDGSFARGIFISMFGALFSIFVGLVFIPEIIRLNSEQIGQKRARSAAAESTEVALKRSSQRTTSARAAGITSWALE